MIIGNINRRKSFTLCCAFLSGFFLLRNFIFIFNYSTITGIDIVNSNNGIKINLSRKGNITSYNTTYKTNLISEEITNTIAPNIGKNSSYLIIHVGPIKTGSSSIQCNLQVNPYLGQSDYIYLGKMERICAKNKLPLNRPKILKYCYLDVQELVFEKMRKGFMNGRNKGYLQMFHNKMAYMYKKGINSIISGEEFCGMSYNDKQWKIFSRLLKIQQEVRFQVVYRHFFDWAISYYSFYEIYNNRKFMNSFSSGKELLSIIDNKVMDETFIFKNKTKCHPYALWTMFRRKTILKNIGNVDVFNFHKEGDLATRFICSLPDSKEACESSKTLKLGIARSTNYDTIHADRIATAAWNAGYFKREMVHTRKNIKNAIRKYVRNDLSIQFLDFPSELLECMNKEKQEEILQRSIKYGKEMLGDNEFDLEAMKYMFRNYVVKNKFCGVNVTAILQHPSWQKFLKNDLITKLRSEKRRNKKTTKLTTIKNRRKKR